MNETDTKEFKVTDAMIRVAAKIFFRDCGNDEGYPHAVWEEQADEFRGMLQKGELSPGFIKFVCEAKFNDQDLQYFHGLWKLVYV